MWALLLLFAILQIAHGSTCPKGYDLVAEGECRGYQTKLYVPFDDATTKAIEQCDKIQGKTAIIHNEEHQSYWKGKAPATTDGFLILGLVCNAGSKKWEWADGSALNFKPATNLYNPELDKPCTVGYSWDIHPDGYWSYGGPGNYINAYIYCTTQLQEPTSFDDSCQDKVCYQVSGAVATWQDGQDLCRNYGGNLASIHSSKANTFIRRLAISSGALSGVFIGASTYGTNNPFSWSDRSNMDYEQYAPGFPKANFGDCVAMDTSSSSGDWMNYGCSAKLPVVCARKEGVETEPTCDDIPPKEGDMFFSPGFPNSASTPCEYFLTAATGKKVALDIAVLEANSCCDTLTLTDGYLGGAVIAKLTGNLQNATYTTKSSNVMRVSWQPKSGRNVKGVAMTFRGV